MSVLKKLLLGSLVVALLCLGSAATALADTTTFNFETLGTTTGGALSSITLTQSGLTMTLTRPGSTFDIINLVGNPGFPASWGARTLDPFAHSDSPTVFNANFSLALSSFTIGMGDFTPSDFDTLTVTAYDALDGGGSVVGTATTTCCDTGSGFVFTSLTVTGAGIRSVRFIGGSPSFPNSVYYDNLTATFGTTVPEPATMILLGTGLAGLAARFRRRTRA